MVEEVAFEIREGREQDLPALEWEGAYRHFRGVYKRAMREASRGRRMLLVAEVEDRVVGQIFIQFNYFRGELDDGVPSGYLHAFRVRPEHRGQGIGTQLLRRAEDALRARRLERAVVAVARENKGALRLYKRLGYHILLKDPGIWNFVDHNGQLRHVHEPSYLLGKLL
jgi:ribosomal protein S18 acetylase RimI-like enzyme